MNLQSIRPDHRVGLLTTGILFTLLGVLALTHPVKTALGLAFGLGFLLLMNGAILLVEAIYLRNERRGKSDFLPAIISILLGFLVFLFPDNSMFMITFTLSFYFFVSTASRWNTSKWGRFSAITSLALAILTLLVYPVLKYWMPGIFLGTDLFVFGVTSIGLFVSSSRQNHFKEITETKKIAA